ncbi:MAG: hypothetical protein PVJ61_03180 [Dehalococcoidia bacterium]|jgi:hypothetical protein
MPSETQIISEIENIVGTSYTYWTIGITIDPSQCKKQHHNPSYWHYCDAGSESSARHIEEYFVDKGMKGETGGGSHPHYVYIF